MITNGCPERVTSLSDYPKERRSVGGPEATSPYSRLPGEVAVLRLALVSCREQSVAPAIQERPANRADFSRLVCLGPYFPMQKVAKMRLRMSSAVVAPVMASMGWRAA